MKIKWLTLTVLSVLLLALTGIAVQAQVSGVDPAQCAVMSWSPEMFSFYGDKATVVSKFEQLDRDLLKHRVFAFVVETNRGAKLTFFELAEGGNTMDLGTLEGDSFNELSNRISTTLLANTGTKCAGMTAKDIIHSYANGRMAHGIVPRPATAGEAFKYAVAQADGEYIRATFILLC
jgi:hypothetical protein